MAFLGQDDKEKQGLGLQQANTLQAGSVGNPGGAVVSGDGGANPVSTAGVGAGGTGGWVNIQSYLNANKGVGGASDAFSKTVGDVLDTEKKTIEDSANSTKQAATKEVENKSYDNNKAYELLDQAAQQYQFSKPQQNTQYQDAINKFKAARSAQYQGPDSFTAMIGSQARDYGDQLASDDGFNSIMQGIYSKASPTGGLNSGQSALQQQLSANDENLGNARKNMLAKYASLKGFADDANQSTAKEIQAARNRLESNKKGLETFLNEQGRVDANRLNAAVAGWNSLEGQIAHGDYRVNPGGQTIESNPLARYVAPTQKADIDNVGAKYNSVRKRYNAIFDALGADPSKALKGVDADLQHGGWVSDPMNYQIGSW